jgi:hypothetical protein
MKWTYADLDENVILNWWMERTQICTCICVRYQYECEFCFVLISISIWLAILIFSIVLLTCGCASIWEAKQNNNRSTNENYSMKIDDQYMKMIVLMRAFEIYIQIDSYIVRSIDNVKSSPRTSLSFEIQLENSYFSLFVFKFDHFFLILCGLVARRKIYHQKIL